MRLGAAASTERSKNAPTGACAASDFLWPLMVMAALTEV